MMSTNVNIEAGKRADAREFSLLMTANMLIGAFIGSACAYSTFNTAPGFSLPFTVTMAAIAGAAVGGTGGMLIGGLIDIVARGRLDQ